MSSWCCDPQQISPNGPNLSSSGPLRSAARRENWLFLSPAKTRQQFIQKKKSSLGKSLVVCCSVNLTVVWDAEKQSSDSSPTLRQMRLCAALPPGAGSCDVPQLAVMQGDPRSPQRNSYQLPVLGFSRES